MTVEWPNSRHHIDEDKSELDGYLYPASIFAAIELPKEAERVLPPDLPQPFTNRDLATALGLRLNLAQKMSYTLRKAELLEVVGKRGNALLFARVLNSNLAECNL